MGGASGPGGKEKGRWAPSKGSSRADGCGTDSPGRLTPQGPASVRRAFPRGEGEGGCKLLCFLPPGA